MWKLKTCSADFHFIGIFLIWSWLRHKYSQVSILDELAQYSAHMLPDSCPLAVPNTIQNIQHRSPLVITDHHRWPVSFSKSNKPSPPGNIKVGSRWVFHPREPTHPSLFVCNSWHLLIPSNWNYTSIHVIKNQDSYYGELTCKMMFALWVFFLSCLLWKTAVLHPTLELLLPLESAHEA